MNRKVHVTFEYVRNDFITPLLALALGFGQACHLNFVKYFYIIKYSPSQTNVRRFSAYVSYCFGKKHSINSFVST